MIRLDPVAPTPGLIKKLIDDHDPWRFKVLQDYYCGYSDILDRAMDKGRPNNKLVNCFPTYIVDVSTGYFMGKPVSYTASEANNDFLDELKSIFDYNDESDQNMELSKTMSINGRAYELLYLDDSDDVIPRFTTLNPETVIMTYDRTISAEPSMAIRHFKDHNLLTGKEYLHIEVMTREEIYYYQMDQKGNVSESEPPIQHYFDGVPVIEYLNNDEGQGDFEKVITLINAYDLSQSDTMNDFEYFSDAYLKIKNLSGTTSEDVEEMKRDRTILVDGDGDADFLIKNINDSAIENFKSRLQEDIHRFSMTPNLTDESFASNLSGVAIAYKLWGLEQSASQKERKFKRSLQRRIELICNFLKRKGRDYSWREISIIFTRNIPQNTKEYVEMVTMLKGIISDQTAISQLPFIDDPIEELERLEEQNYGSVDLREVILDDRTKQEIPE